MKIVFRTNCDGELPTNSINEMSLEGFLVVAETGKELILMEVDHSQVVAEDAARFLSKKLKMNMYVVSFAEIAKFDGSKISQWATTSHPHLEIDDETF